MSGLTTYRLPHNGLPEKQADIDRVRELIMDVGGVPDGRLQAIADAWGPSSDRQSDCRYDLPELARLLDGLVNDE
jgi:hypothetical protein